MSETFSFERVDKAVEYLTTSAEPYALAKGRRVWLEGRLKIEKSAAFLASAGNGTVADRDAIAHTAEAYAKCNDELRDAVVEEEKLKALRIAAEAKVEVWRSLESSRRAANV